jgi:hypothetical protein
MTQKPDDPDDPDDDPVRSAMIEAEVKRASRPFEGVWPDDVLEEMRRLHRIALRTHPAMQELLDQLCPAPMVKRSDKIATSKFKAKKDTKAGGT